jgi:hypothetical protein
MAVFMWSFLGKSELVRWKNDDTRTLALYLVDLQSTWCIRFFFRVHFEEDRATYDERKWIALFKEAVMNDFPLFFDGKTRRGISNLNAGQVDWEQIYSHWYAFTKPENDIFKQDED